MTKVMFCDEYSNFQGCIGNLTKTLNEKVNATLRLRLLFHLTSPIVACRMNVYVYIRR